MGRSPCCAKEGLNRGAWTAVEDKMLTDYVTVHGEGGWRNLPKRAGLKRCGKSCRLRWLNYLRPDIKRGNISEDEEDLIIRLHKLLGNRWSLIAGRLSGRTDNEIKNYWNTTLCKKVQDDDNNDNNNNNNHHHHHLDHNYKYSESAAAPTSKLSKQKQKPTRTVSEPRVIRPKAFRCCAAAKVCINEQPGIEKSKPPLAAADSFHIEDNDNMPSTLDFLLGVDNIGELCLSDLLNPEVSLQDDIINDNNTHDYVVLSSSSPDLTTPEKIISSEFAVNGGHSTGTTTHSDVNLSFTSFLDCQVADDHQFELVT